jgi:iron(III) transport system permease protein
VVVAVSALIALALVSPLGLLVWDAHQTGWAEIHRVLFRERSWYLLRHTVTLMVLVVALAATIGVAVAWLTERTSLPGRRVWTALLVLPLAMPDFVVGFAWHSVAPRLNGLFAATLVMTLGTYPLVQLPVAAALRRTDPAMEDTARSLGASRSKAFFRVTLPLLRPAILGGSVLVALTVISEYGAFEILRYQTFTTEVFGEFQIDPRAAVPLAVPLVIIGLLVLLVEVMVPRRVAHSLAAHQNPRRADLGRATGPALAFVSALVAVGVGMPIGTLVYWIVRAQHTTFSTAATLGGATWTTVTYSAWGALVAVAAALPVAMLSHRRASMGRRLLERSTFVTKALPGVVVALSLVFFATHYAYGLYQTSYLLVAAYAVLNFPLALVCVKTSVAQAPVRLSDVGRSLGRGPVSVFVRVTLPLLVPGLLAGFCLVFLTAVTELTATLVLAPIGVKTLATQFWASQGEFAYSQAAPYALIIILIAVIPGAFVGLWFDRERRTAAA